MCEAFNHRKTKRYRFQAQHGVCRRVCHKIDFHDSNHHKLVTSTVPELNNEALQALLMLTGKGTLAKEPVNFVVILKSEDT
jgi:hypothetical protein